MKHQKDLSDLFRANAHKLEERPSPRAWRRLESRLDEHKSRHKQSLFRQWTSVAAIALLLIVATFAIYLPQSTTSNEIALNTAPTVLEDLSNYTEEGVEVQKVMEFTRKHINRMSNPVEEGTASKRLIPNVE